MADEYQPSLQNVIDATALKWIFVGGKGGVGKTTTSCCLGVQLAKARRNVLIVSTDPAHNLSDAFGQKFGRSPTLVTGFTNLYCMEIDPNVQADDTPEELAQAGAAAGAASGGLSNADFSKLLRDYGGQIPGIDELMSFAELMQQVQKLEFDVTVFDTAPTGHTLRLLSLPRMIDNLLVKLLGLRSTFGPLLTSMNTMMGAASSLPSEALIVGKLEELKKVIDAVNSRIHSADETTFVCVCIPEFLSLYETERLVQELVKHDIDTHNIVVNQVLFSCAVDAAAAGGKGTLTCGRCNARSRMQAKYLEQIGELYGDMFHVIKTPLLNEEVRGAPKLTDFGSFLLAPYDPSAPLPATLADKA